MSNIDIAVENLWGWILRGKKHVFYMNESPQNEKENFRNNKRNEKKQENRVFLTVIIIRDFIVWSKDFLRVGFFSIRRLQRTLMLMRCQVEREQKRKKERKLALYVIILFAMWIRIMILHNKFFHSFHTHTTHQKSFHRYRW
jgi:hypothetical protein